MEEHSRLTPGAKFVVVQTNGRHDPTKAFDVPGTEIKVGQGDLFKEILKNGISVTQGQKEPGFSVVNLQYPHYPFPKGSLSSGSINSCSAIFSKIIAA
jgi:hypothetical protein